MGNLSVLEEANVRVCGCVCLCVGASLCIRVSGGGAGRCPGPHPSAAPLPAASLSHLLWQMFGCPWQRQNRMYLWIATGTSPHSQAAHTVPFPKGLLQRTTWVQVGDKWCLYQETGRAGILRGVSGRGGGGRMCTAQLSPSSSGLVSVSLCPSEDAKEAAWAEQLPSAGLVCGHRITVFPTIIATTHGGSSLCRDSCSVLHLANNIYIHAPSLCADDTALIFVAAL